MTITCVTKAGRLANGFERDGGRVVHAIEGKFHANQHGPALCGTSVGRTSGGWVEADGHITCPKCLRAMRAARVALMEQFGAHNRGWKRLDTATARAIDGQISHLSRLLRDAEEATT